MRRKGSPCARRRFEQRSEQRRTPPDSVPAPDEPPKAMAIPDHIRELAVEVPDQVLRNRLRPEGA